MEEKVLNAMKEADKPVRPGEIAKALDVDSKEVSKAIKSLKNKGEIISPKRCYYSLPWAVLSMCSMILRAVC